MLKIRPDSVLPEGKYVEITVNGKTYRAKSLQRLAEQVGQQMERVAVYERAAIVVGDKREPVKVVPLTSSAVYTVTALLLKGLKRQLLVDRKIAEQRAAICANCPMNVHVPCLSCIGLHMLAGVLFKKCTTSVDKKLESCAICRCVNKYQIWCTPETLAFIAKRTGPGKDAYPDGCWKKEVLP